MADKRLLAAGRAAALGSIILVLVLLGIAFGIDLGTGKGKEESSDLRSTGEVNTDKETSGSAGAEEEAGSAEVRTDEQADILSTAMEQADSAAEIMTLTGKDLWSRFDGAVLTGDSRVVGFSLYTGIPDSNVKARNGATIALLPEFVPEIAALKPESVFVAYGINDIKSAVGGKTAAQYAEYAGKKISEMEKALDGAEIYVNSILPVSPSLAEQDPEYRKVDAYNRELKEMCRKHGWHFIDNDSIAAKYADLYVSDGIHLEAGFYEHWGRNMLMVQAGVHTGEGGTGVDR